MTGTVILLGVACCYWRIWCSVAVGRRNFSYDCKWLVSNRSVLLVIFALTEAIGATWRGSLWRENIFSTADGHLSEHGYRLVGVDEARDALDGVRDRYASLSGVSIDSAVILIETFPIRLPLIHNIEPNVAPDLRLHRASFYHQYELASVFRGNDD